jgi:FtsP/CotA-like multicopper oxidase with cupredoxin domain
MIAPGRRLALSVVAGLGGLVVLALVGWIGVQWWDSRLPSTYDAMRYAKPDAGGGPMPTHNSMGHMLMNEQGAKTSVADLTGPPGAPAAKFTLSAQAATVRLPSGREVEALTFNGSVPGPELRVREGELVEVTLVNRDVDAGVSIHWHGVDVPNAEDGVAGVTQDAVLPGDRYVYRFRPDRAGTFWYHAHQTSSSEVRRGLFGVLVVEPRTSPAQLVDLALPSHELGGVPTLAGSDLQQRRSVPAGARVRVRLINTDNSPQRFTVDGGPFRLLAIDGNEVLGPTPLTRRTLKLAAGGRYDVGFTMATPIRIGVADTNAAVVFSTSGKADVRRQPAGPELDPIAYGTPGRPPFGSHPRFDRRFRLSIGRKPGFFDGRPGMQWTINGGIYPRVPMFMVRQGDLVEVTVENHTSSVHPMHLHGHRMLVLSRDGERPSGSPWWTDTLDVEPGQRFELAFRADNPGIWMDHCHNLTHAAAGLTMHVAYEGVTTPFRIGGAAHNHPE